jgi:anti-sigma factor RsiW
MSSHIDDPEPDPRELAELSALADGSLDPSRRREVESRIAASAQLRERYERERRVVELLRTAAAGERAPAQLRRRIEASRPRARAAARRRLVYGGSLATAMAAVGLTLALVLPSGTPGAPSVSQAAGLAVRGPAAAAPVADPQSPEIALRRRIEGVYFPNLESHFGWRAIGQRTDRINGREAITVYYATHRGQVAYTIVAAPALAQPAAAVTVLNGTELRTLTLAGRLVVTWRREGHTCVLSATDVGPTELQRIAAWTAPGADRS